MVKVEITWWSGLNGGGSGRNGAIDNVVFNDVPPAIAMPRPRPPQSPPRARPSRRRPRTTTPNPTVALYLGGHDPARGAAAPIFTDNNTNTAKNTTAYFSAAGNYVFTVTVTDGSNLVATQTVPATVSQTASGITITPASPTVGDSAPSSSPPC